MRRPVLLEHGKVSADHLGELARQARAAGVGGDRDDVFGQAEIPHVLREHRQRSHVVDRDVEEALDLARVEVHREDAVGARRLDHLRDELRGDPLARPGLLVLARVGIQSGSTAVIRFAEASFAASIMIISSIRFWSTGGELVWTMKRSEPRIDSS